jgi:hypothetical protein
MGTNYYVEEQEPCKCCGRPYEDLHIGKSSAGWCFSLHVIPERNLNDLNDWIDFLKCKRILNEYGEDVLLVNLISEITNRSHPGGIDLTEYIDKYTERGPNNLLRSRIDEIHCVGHGKGTWDYIIGEFS